MPAICPSSLYKIAKSFSPKPWAHAEDNISFTMAAVGSGTCKSRPSSSASDTSFCIIVVLNCAWSGIFRISGPLYCTSGDAIALLVAVRAIEEIYDGL